MNDNCIQTVKQLLKDFNISYTSKYLKNNILSHPDHPSLLSISDTLEKYKIETLAIKVDFDKLKEMPLPCIVQVQIQNENLFFVLKRIQEKTISYYDQKDRIVEISKDDFVKIWTGVSLLAETSIYSKEIDIEKKMVSAYMSNILKIGIAVFMMIWIIITFLNSEIAGTTKSLVYIIYTILKGLGVAVASMLLWFDIDQYNPTLQSFCKGSSQKVNCNSVLTSKHSKFFKGNIHISELTFAYFFATFMYLIISRFLYTSLSLVGFLSFCTIPIIVASIYYQVFIIKQLCKFCIIIQVILVCEVLISFFGNFCKSKIELTTIPLFIILFLIPIFIWKMIKPILEEIKEINLYKRGLKKIKNNPDVLESLLMKSKKIETSTEGLGISIINETAKYKIIKVCNPYCGPCANAHPFLEALLDSGKIDLQMLFTANADNVDVKAKPVSHFLAIDAGGDKKKTQQALDDWYLSEKKNYDEFAKKYPMNGEISHQKTKIEAMYNWCNAENITRTPTIFINGYELPKEYNIEDLLDVL